MNSFSIYSLALALAVAASCALAFVSFLRRQVAGAVAFGCLMTAAAAYALGSLFEIRSSSVDELFLWLRFEYLGISFIGPLWLSLAFDVAGIRSPKLKGLGVGVVAFSVLTLVMVWTNGSHGIFYRSLQLVPREGFSVAVVGRGPWYWAHILVMNACVLGANAILLGRALRAPAAYRAQSVAMLAASLFPWAGMFAYLSGLSPLGLDLAPFGIPASGLLFSWSLFRHRFLDLGVIAYERIFEDMREGVLIMDRKGRVLGANPAMTRLLGVEGRDCVGEDARGLCAPCQALAQLVAREPPAEADLRIESGESVRHYAAKLAPIHGRGGDRLGAILSLDDITVRADLLRRLSELATVDGLTGVSNRRTFLDVAGLELLRARRHGLPLSLLMLDLDKFKSINDRFGHQAGDAALKAAAGACAACLRATDRFGRYGGEEFVALLPGVGPEEAGAAAERLRQAVEALRVDSGGGRELRLTASLGCAGRERIGTETIDALLKEADEALYRAKAAGRNRVERGRPSAAEGAGLQPPRVPGAS